ncbi:MAG: ATP-binding protein [Candidatus Vecturithrix sp.]|jgi:MinD superfamily P-loop ATPase|nr:ATP-binding protein [Candidatus Vecturithrix sp.]
MDMKELVIISGKGGTGKTSLTASFAALAKNAVLADCDVDAADLHLLLHPIVRHQELFRSGRTAVIDADVCIQCGKCRELCRFDAIDETFTVNSFACEGCAVCAHFCPVNAIAMQENVCGEWYVSDTHYGPMVHARLGIAEENSGKLVSLVRQQAQRLAKEQQKSLILIDGPPGIGCPVISSISGANMVLAVTEPTVSGLHDLQRVAELTAHFNIPTGVCVNKATINPEITCEIQRYCATDNLRFLGEIPFDRVLVDALLHQQPVVEYSHGDTVLAIRRIWERMLQWSIEHE